MRGGGGSQDLWTYDPTADQFAWVGGVTTLNGQGVYPGTKGTFASANLPPASCQ